MTIQKQPFMLADNLVVVVRQMHPNRGPHLNIMYGGLETDNGSIGQPACTIAVYGEQAIQELQAACAFALLPKTVQKLEGA